MLLFATGSPVSNSSLVKTGIAGEDTNWAGSLWRSKAGEPIEAPKAWRQASAAICRARDGTRVPDQDERRVARHLKGCQILIEVTVGSGTGQATFWTCALPHGSSSINTDQRS